MIRNLTLFLASTLLFGCTKQVVEVSQPPPPQVYTSVGYGYESSYKNYPAGQRRLLAIRAAKLDAYRSIAEEFHGTRIRGLTTVRDMAVESDSYRAYVNAVVRGARLSGVTPKGDGVYEAEVELRLNTPALSCLNHPTSHCLSTRAVAVTTRCQEISRPGCRVITRPSVDCRQREYWQTASCVERYPETYYVMP